MEIELPPGAHTYWRMPGSSGVSPTFSFAGSDNLLAAEVLYPAPTRISEDGGDVFGYLGGVVLPLHVTPVNPARAVALAMTITYAVCEHICIPVKASSELVLPPKGDVPTDPGPYRATIARAEARVPRRIGAAERDAKIEIRGEPSLGAWRLIVREGSAQDLFAEAPDGWYLETSKSGGANEFLIVAAERPKLGWPGSIPVIFTVTTAQQNYEFASELDTTVLHRENLSRAN